MWSAEEGDDEGEGVGDEGDGVGACGAEGKGDSADVCGIDDEDDAETEMGDADGCNADFGAEGPEADGS
ncbi:hypothetical protein OZX74_08615 [Bifidobacterium sp. ESL0798]|uniref:hypothetical protein n=1 Tax=Bifidobacterium sp. ESL0798 TaxID=2983235 RepID=UPI0023F71C6F|nr:hypothetical protein [Bifidobacterium sp. ESL0798]WEV73923.1 hypothetical protein OZX74_08615 [Bifidobacterium sp. ESL0798]